MMIKKLSGLLLAGMLTAAMGLTSFAALEAVPTPTDGFTVTINKVTNDKADHTYEAYQIFSGTLAKDTEAAAPNNLVLDNVQWGTGVKSDELLAALKADTDLGFLFADVTKASQAADAMSKLTAAQATKLADIVSAHLNTAATVTQEKGVITIADPGYYFIKDRDGSLKDIADTAYTKFILQVVGDQTVTEKTDVPTIDKKIDGSKDADSKTTGMVESDTVSVGSSVPYVVTSKVPDMTNYEQYYFIVSDKMTEGLTFNDDIEITIGDKKLDADAYTVEKDAATNSFELVFKNFIQYKDKAGEAITITYSATVNENAKSGTVSNDNDVKLTYSNNPNKKGEGTDKPGPNDKDVTGETPWEKVKTYTIGIIITKFNNEGDKLTDAKFSISGDKISATIINKEIFVVKDNDTSAVSTDGKTYYRLKDGTYTETVMEEATKDKYDLIGADGKELAAPVAYVKVKEVTKTTTTETVNQEAWVDENSNVTFDGLSEGTYKIHEVKSPEGYNLLKEDVIITISYDTDKDGNLTQWKATQKLGENGEEKSLDFKEATNYYDVTIVNNRGSFLPSTGGAGTTILYIVALAVGVISFVGRKVTKKAAK